MEQFEEEVTAFLDENAERRTPDTETRFVWGEGDDSVAMFEEIDPEEERRQLAAAKRWRATRFDA
ncbi:MAG: acyl-CoA dehydrogenase, partial [Actinobacteria bacterium]|nr:acyl-CoA dehydrogenase [Actinomycetota bacterium]NIV90129.1 acyl-CoA dehydrogenase [Actinomycetota bacterium]